MGKRHETIGIKQAIRLEWMQKVADLLLAGLDAKMVRQELHKFLAERKGNGSEGKCSDQTRTFVVNNLMKIWVSPELELIPFQDASLAFLREQPSMGLAVHWGMISAAYPFWFNVATCVGRLLNLQNQVAQSQVVLRLKEIYGDRQTVSRRARYVIRSFVAWGVLKDTEVKGCYERVDPESIHELNLAILMLEGAMHAIPDGKWALGPLLNNPAFFPFKLLVMTGNIISRRNDRIDVVRYGLNDELLKLNASSSSR